MDNTLHYCGRLWRNDVVYRSVYLQKSNSPQRANYYVSLRIEVDRSVCVVYS